jgi:hypothetical protein
MTQYRDRIPLPPPDAQRTNMTCHFCIVGCGYHVYKWPENREGGRAPEENALGLDFRRQVPPLTVIMTPPMHNVVTDRDGSRHHIMILPDKECAVRPRRRRRRLREHLGHRQADVHALQTPMVRIHNRRPTTPSATPPATWAWAS